MQNTLTTFFIQVPPPFELLASEEAELKYKLLFNEKLQTTVVPGGFNIEVEYYKGVTLNHYLKIPNKILLVLKTFKCRDLPKLFNQISKFKWKHYIGDKTPKFIINTKQSRLINTSKIEKTLVESFKRSNQMFLSSKKEKEKTNDYQHFNLYIQIIDDNCTVSLDTSGERMSLRKERIQVGLAPIRENLAAALIYQTIKNLKGHYNFFDPMCGSGVFIIEVNNFFKPTTRDYAYKHFVINIEQPKLTRLKSNISFNLYGNDKSKEQLQICENNLKNCQIECLLSNEDILNIEKKDLKDCIIITNPPYGKRVNIEDSNFENKLVQKIKAVIDYKYFGLISLNRNKKNILKFKNGGIPLFFNYY